MTTKEQLFLESLEKTPGFLHFEDGTSFSGTLNIESNDPRLEKGIWGEAAFTTGMTGYQETMTDPSFLGQHIIFSSPHIGNYPSDEKVNQSNSCHGTSIIAKSFSPNKFLMECEAPLFTCHDTRALVKFITGKKGNHKSVITVNSKSPSSEEFEKEELKCNRLDLVSSEGPSKVLMPGKNPIVLIDYGCKKAIINNLKNLGFPLVIVGHKTKASEILDFKPRMIFLSNGPGDPRSYSTQIEEVKKLLTFQIPIRGICLGHQLITLALEASIIKLPFGQRGVNHPCIEHETGKVIITSQNHGYAASKEELTSKFSAENNILGKELFISYTSLFDNSVEGISSTDHFLKTVQFHPEAYPGTHDGDGFFKEIKNYLTEKQNPIEVSSLEKVVDLSSGYKKEVPYSKVLIIGSGPIKIGQASEFDYSGTQACKVLMALGIEVVLLNSNPATIMTDSEMATKTYLEPITKETLKKIVEKENIQAVLSTLGGQTALNLCIDLEEEGYFKKNNVALLGANTDTIRKTEDRELFAKELLTLGYHTGERYSAFSQDECIQLAHDQVGFPLIIRRDFALGGKGAALVYNEKELIEVFSSDIKFPITLERSLVGWKEIELEVMVDKEKNGVIICSIENIDPCGVHTGDSITVAPAQTISDQLYQNLRTMALNVAKHMGVVAGGANVQFAINPHNDDDIVVIEMNPRVSRSSALASKATGYPIAKISALLSLGYTLKEILNDITKASPVAFEPTLDYVAVKIPLFPFSKFPTSSKVLGPQMRSVGEVLSLGSTFNEAFMKALRSLELGLEIPELSRIPNIPLDLNQDFLTKRLSSPHQLSLLTCMEALRKEVSLNKVHELTQISPWFLEQINVLVNAENKIRNRKNKEIKNITKEEMLSYKKLGMSDKHIATLLEKTQKEVLSFRLENNLSPVYKAVDTCSGEFFAETPYFYSTYTQVCEASPLSKKGKSVAVLGSGPNRIGQGIEFDYSCVKSCQRLREKNTQAIMINSNPETVSTDYDSSDRLYLSPLYSEDIFDILLHEKPDGIITPFSGQTGIAIREHIEKSFRKEFASFNFLGPNLESLQLTEDRKLFSDLLKKVNISQTKAVEVKGHKALMNAIIDDIGLPAIIRPSYVIGGESMYIFNSYEDTRKLPPSLLEQLEKKETVFQVETCLERAIEYDVDLVRDEFGNTLFTICEHIEHAGVHSGDSGMISPPVKLTESMLKQIESISIQLSEALNIIGPINFQYAVKNNEEIYCIEANPRGSRTLPFLSKANDISIPGIATDAMLGESIKEYKKKDDPPFCVKQSTFPFDRFLQDKSILGPKMRSTGETFGMDIDKEQSVLKSYLGNYPNLLGPGKLLISLADKNKTVILPYIKTLHQMGYRFMATQGTYQFIKKQGLPCEKVTKIADDTGLSILEALKDSKLKMVLNTPMNPKSSKSDGEEIRNTAIAYGIPCFTRPENIIAIIESLIGSKGSELIPISLQEKFFTPSINNNQTTEGTI